MINRAALVPSVLTSNSGPPAENTILSPAPATSSVRYVCWCSIAFLSFVYFNQWCGLRPSILGQDRSDTKKSVLVLQVWTVWYCFVKNDLVTLVDVIVILKDTATFQVLVSLFCGWNITTVEINSGVQFTYLKVKSAKCLCLLPVVLILVMLFWSCLVSSGLGLCLVTLVLVLRLWSCSHHWF